MGKFGDIDEAKAKVNLNAEIKAMLMLLFQMFSGSRQNTADKIHNFIPHLKRTDRDCGSLPFFANTFTSHKTNKEHILLSMISKVVQTYWDIVDDTKEVAIEVIDEFGDVLTVLNEISKDNIDNFGVYPISNLRFSLMSKENLDKLEVEAVKKERAEAEKAEEQEAKAREDEAEGKKLMEAELGLDDSTSQDSPSTQSTKTAEDGSKEAAPLAPTGDGNSTDQQPAEVTQPKLVEDTESGESSDGGESSATSQDETATTKDTEQVSVEDADKCSGDCDNCDNAACQTNQTDATDEDGDEGAADQSEVDEAEREDNLNGAVVGGNVPGSLADEQGGKDTIPPMPEEEKDSQAAVDHETGDDQVSEPPAPPEKVEVKRKTD